MGSILWGNNNNDNSNTQRSGSILWGPPAKKQKSLAEIKEERLEPKGASYNSGDYAKYKKTQKKVEQAVLNMPRVNVSNINVPESLSPNSPKRLQPFGAEKQIDQRIRLSSNPADLDDSRNYIGMNIVPTYENDEPLEKVAKGVINYGVGGPLSVAGNTFGALGQAGMQLVTNTGRAIEGKPLDFSEKSLKEDILPKEYGQFVDDLAQKGPLGSLASGFISGGVEGGLDPGTWIGGAGVLDDLSKAGRFGKAGALGTTENVINVGDRQMKLIADKIKAGKNLTAAEQEVVKRNPDFFATSGGTVGRSIEEVSTPPKQPLALPAPKEKPVGQTMIDMARNKVGINSGKGTVEAPHQIYPGEVKPGMPMLNGLEKPLAILEAPKPTAEIKKPVFEETKLETIPGVPKGPTKLETAKDLAANSDNWKDKKGLTGPLRLQRETEERNILDVAGPVEGQRVKEALFTPIHENEAANVRMKNLMRNTIKSFNLTKKESEAVQKYGEGKWIETTEVLDPQTSQKVTQNIEHTYKLDDLKHDFPNSWQKITKATDVFRDIYKELIDQSNAALVRNGYKPVGELKNYFPHFQGEDPVMKALGIKLDVEDLPTDINGLTHQFRPGKKWVGNFLHREGQKTTYDAVQGFDRYIEAVGKVIHHTDDIQRLRTFIREIRTKYSPKEIQDQVDVLMKTDMPKEFKDAALDELLGRSKTHLSNYVANLEEYTNVLAGKKDLADRAAERIVGRKIYNVANFLENRIAKNMVALNPASWMTNFIPITQSLATTNKKAVLEGLAQTMKNVVQNDGFINKSTFLTNRVGSDILSKSAIEKSADIFTAPFKWIDNFTSQVVTRSKYLEGLDKGLSSDAAMKKADEWAAKIIGDRSTGAQPTLFNQRNPITRLAAQFQLEVNNQLSFLFKDMPREYLKNGANAKEIAKLTAAVGQLAIYGWLYNQLYEQLTGRRPALDPIGIAFDFKNDLKNPNLKKSKAFANLANNTVQQLPFAGSFVGGGRLPISAAMPDVGAIADTVIKMATGETPADEGWGEIGGELGKTALYLIPPFGGGQIKKSYEGLSAYNQGGDYNGSQLKYPIDKSVGNAVTAGVFGKYATPEARDYYNNNRRPLSDKQTAAYKELVNQGEDPQRLYEFKMDQRRRNSLESKMNEIAKDPELSDNEKRRRIQAIYPVYKALSDKLGY